MNQPTLEQTLLEPLELLKQEAEVCNAFLQAVSKMRELQITVANFSNCACCNYTLESAKNDCQTAEKQVDDFLAKRRANGND